ncbi:FAD-binding protein [Saccharothrix sp. NRRL B-16348]|uniref:FAD-binding protein n=1 Tax=Saccharothrix sp. NRRL B-16348 TaxID=1415542 RepID=UPI0006AEE835|nr:FAD-binding protein [Saccharothrix sp. NRRL B-16348]
MLGFPDDVLVTDAAALDWAADDFGHVVRQRPVGVLRTTSADDVAAVVRLARARGLAVVPRAEGHSTGGQAQAAGGIVLDMTGFRAVHRVTAEHAVVDAGARWSDVLAATLPLGVTPPVLTDYLDLSVGGTLSVGGLGGASHHFGAQTDNVVELLVVTPDGERVTCSPTFHPDVFDAVRAGRGRRGVILRATVRLVPAHTHARCFRLRYDRLADFLHDQRLLMAERRFDHLEGRAKPDGVGGWGFRIDATAYFTPPGSPPEPLDGLRDRREAAEVDTVTYRHFANRMADDVAALRVLGPWRWPHPWLNVLLPDAAAEAVLAESLAGLVVGDTGVVLVYPVPRARFHTPGLRLPDSPTAFLLALLRTADSASTLRAMVEHNHALLRLCSASGATTYLP